MVAPGPADFLNAHDHPTPEGVTPLYLVIDAARDPAIFDYLLEHQDDLHLECLYKGDSAHDLAEVAPYLMALEPDGEGPAWRFLRQQWGRSCLIVLQGDVDFTTLRLHLRKLTFARMPSGDMVLFRFYDPRVMRLILPTCEPGQLDRLFGPVQQIWTEAAQPGEAELFSWNNGILHHSLISLTGA